MRKGMMNEEQKVEIDEFMWVEEIWTFVTTATATATAITASYGMVWYGTLQPIQWLLDDGGNEHKTTPENNQQPQLERKQDRRKDNKQVIKKSINQSI